MAAERETPADETGMPLPLVPSSRVMSIENGDANLHHHFHPRRDPGLNDVEGGQALRNSRVQLAQTYGNHMEYHRHYLGPALPQTVNDRLRLTILAHAGYVPERAILMRGASRKPKIVALADWQREQLVTGGELAPVSNVEAREFFIARVVSQDLSDIRESYIDEFMHTTDRSRRLFLGNWLLAKAIERAVEPVDAVYRSAWRDGRIPRHLPTNSPNFVSRAIGRAVYRKRAVQRLEMNLAA